MRRLLAPLLLVATACVLPPFEIEGKECDTAEPCPADWFCAPRSGTPRGICTATQPTCPSAPLDAPCDVGSGACLRTGRWICTIEGPACSELPGAASDEVCNGADDDCDGETDEAPGCMHTVAGAGGPPGFADGPAEQARFGGGGFLTLAANGDLLVADTYAHAIRRVDPSGTVTTLAGNGRCGFSDGPAAQSALCLPGEVVEAADGALYFSDTGNARLRMIRDGVVSTVAGSGERGFADGPALTAQLRWPVGLALLSDGTVVVADRDNHRLRLFTPGASSTLTTYAGTGDEGYLDGNRLQMQLRSPVDVANAGGGGLFVTESHLIRSVGAGSSLVAGWDTPGFADNFVAAAVRFNGPLQLAPSGGQLLVADPGNHRLRVTDLGNGSTATVMAGPGFSNGAAGASSTARPVGVAFLGGNTWAFLDGNARLRKITGDLVTNSTTDFSGGSWVRQTADGDGAEARLFGPRGLAITPSGELWWLEPGPSLVRRLTEAGQVETVAGRVDAPGTRGYVNGGFGDARVSSPAALAAGPDGRIYVSDRQNHALRVFDPASRQVTTLAGPLTALAGLVNGTLSASRFSSPGALWVGARGGGAVELFVFDAQNRVLRRVRPQEDAVITFAGTEGTLGTADGAVGVGTLSQVVALCSHGDGGLWVLEDGRRLRRVDASGTLTTPLPLLNLGGELGEAMACDTGGKLIIGAGGRLVQVDPEGGGETTLFPAPSNPAPLGFVDGTAQGAAALQLSGVALTPSAVWVTDAQANRVRRLSR